MIKSDFIKGLTIVLGTMVGAGLFSLPYITARVGLWVICAFCLVLGGIMVLEGLMYSELVLRAKQRHRFPGYLEKYLGKGGKIFGFLSSGLAMVGTLLAYLLIGGGFLFSLVSPILGGSYFLYILIYFAAGAALIFFGIKSIAQTEALLIVLFLAILLLIFYQGFSLIKVDNLFSFDSAYLFLPYGAVLFSFSAAGAIPEAREILRGKSYLLRRIIIISAIIAFLVYLFFIIVVLGISGSNTTKEAIIGLKGALSEKMVGLALFFGLLTTFTSFLAIGLSLKKTLWYDGGLSKHLSWFLACFIPLSLFLLGFQNFIEIISLVGGVALGLRLILVVLMHRQADKKGDLEPAYKIRVPSLLYYFLILSFAAGIIYEILYFL